jgi:diguanylate cyclase (GGDEF)-like protein
VVCLFPFQAPAVSSVVVLPIVIEAIIEGFRRAMRATARHAMQDPMTGLHNRRGMYAAVQPLIARDPAAMLVAAVVDLDRFKQINDGRGHQWGDDVLRAVAVALQSSVRRGDLVARVGGDEFVVIAAMDNPERIDSFIERIQTALDTVAPARSPLVSVWLGDHVVTMMTTSWMRFCAMPIAPCMTRNDKAATNLSQPHLNEWRTQC